ncbi:MAG: helix-turn-helix domain-containing protein [Muribaculaceae bacterium]|nr:helix-turn-helix domain-containing protein [Muribaculaceae bacterium]
MEQKLTRVPLHSIDTYNRLYGLETRHPLVAVVDLKKATRTVNHILMDYGVYALFLKNGANCTLKYGRQPYDYQEGTVVSFSPGQLIEVETPEDEVAPDVIGLLFHPDLFYRTPLAAKIRDYRFFAYSQREAVHLSADERRLFTECLDRVSTEIERPVDRHTAGIVASHIQLLLDYLTRFYDRQFITRHKPQSEILNAFESALREFYDAGRAPQLPDVGSFAARANLTPGYFSDLIKKETGKTPQELISLHIIELAKERLSSTSDDVSEIAYDLGFQHPQHFSRMFKRMTGVTPSAYRTGKRSA